MRPLRRLAVVVPAVAAAAALSATPAMAGQPAPGHSSMWTAARTPAHVARPAVPGVTWHNFTLLNGWADTMSGAGQPAWAVSGGIVYLRGIIAQPTGTSRVAGQLPGGARPAVAQLVEVAADDPSYRCFVTITKAGVIIVGAPAYAGERLDTSLSGVSFPAAATARHALTLINGWKAVPGAGAPSYTVSGGFVHLSGDLTRASGTSAVFAKLPAAVRPLRNQYIEVYTDGGVTGELVVGSNGNLTAHWGMSATRTSLGAATFPLKATPITALALNTPTWTRAAAALAAGAPGYSVSGPVACLTGAAKGTGALPALIALVPPAARPVNLVVEITDVQNGAGGMFSLAGNSGLLGLNASSDASAQQMTSLASVCYPVNA